MWHSCIGSTRDNECNYVRKAQLVVEAQEIFLVRTKQSNICFLFPKRSKFSGKHNCFIIVDFIDR